MDNLLAQLERDTWVNILNGAVKPRHPFHQLVLTSGGVTPSRIRTVILRKANPQEKTIRFYTDVRSAKWGDLLKNSQVGGLFYDPIKRHQVIFIGQATLHTSDMTSDQLWASLSIPGRRSYMTLLSPGTASAVRTTGLPAEFSAREPTRLETEAYRMNFGMVEVHVLSLEVLELGKNGHTRASFYYREEKEATGSWLVP